MSFKDYFLRRADVAEKLSYSGCVTDSLILSTTAIDALAKIWFHDFPQYAKKIICSYGGGISEAIKFSQFIKHFAQNDLDANKVAVVCFAEDWKRLRPKDKDIANQLLSKRVSNEPDEFLRSHELPKSYLDVPIDKLKKECPQIAKNRELSRLVEEYEYGTMLYKFYRCPLVHSSTSSSRTHGFARGEAIMYYWSYVYPDRTTISFGPNLIIRWLKVVTINYAQFCQDQGVIPAKNFDAGLLAEKKLETKWSKLQEISSI